MGKKLMLIVRAIFSIPVRIFYACFPKAAMQAAIDQASDQLETARKAVGSSKGLVFRLERQVKEDENDVAKLTKRIERAMEAGDEEKATRYATSLAKERKSLAENKSQLASAQKDYDSYMSLLKKQNENVSAAQDDAQKLGVQLEMSKAQKAQANLSADLKSGLNNSILGDARNNMQRQIDDNRGQAEVAGDLVDDLDDDDDLLDAEADDIMAEFRSKKANSSK